MVEATTEEGDEVNIKKIVRYLELKSQLTTEELQMAETMVGLTESDKEALAGLLRPVRASKPATRRVIEHCVADVNGTACTLTRRARVHKDSSMKDYHEFQPQAQLLDKKSRRASSLAGALKKKSTDREPRCVVCFEVRDHAEHDVANGGHEFTTDLAGRVNAVLDKSPPPPPDDDEERCTATREGGRICNLLLDHNVHQMKTAMGYHEFVGSETAVGVGGD